MTIVKMAKSPKNTGLICTTIPRRPKRDAAEAECGIGHSVIRGLVTNRSMVLRQHCQSTSMDHIVQCADIGQSQIAETFSFAAIPFGHLGFFRLSEYYRSSFPKRNRLILSQRLFWQWRFWIAWLCACIFSLIVHWLCLHMQ